MTNTEISAVLIGPRQIEIQRFAIPEVGHDDGVLEIEVTGVCGSDVQHFKFGYAPVILGHEIVGRIADLGPGAEKVWAVRRGDRVVVETTFGCGSCGECRGGYYRLCKIMRGYGGRIKCDRPPYLWGGYGQYVYLPCRGYVNRCVNDIRRRPSQPLIQWRFHPHTVHRDRRLRSTQGPSDA